MTDYKHRHHEIERLDDPYSSHYLWDKQGFSYEEQANWIKRGFTIYEAEQWRYNKFSPAEAEAWDRKGFGPDKANELRRMGKEPSNFMDYSRGDLRARRKRQARDEREYTSFARETLIEGILHMQKEHEPQEFFVKKRFSKKELQKMNERQLQEISDAWDEEIAVTEDTTMRLDGQW